MSGGGPSDDGNGSGGPCGHSDDNGGNGCGSGKSQGSALALILCYDEYCVYINEAR